MAESPETSAQHGSMRHQRTYRADYRPLPYVVDSVDLQFELALPISRITARLSIARSAGSGRTPLMLNGERLRLASIALNGAPLTSDRYSIDDHELMIIDPPDAFELTIVTEVQPADNPGLEGLNHADGVFYTHCEPQGFRRITYFPDRPDVLARYRCTVIADVELYPVLLSNGSLDSTGTLADGRHFACWQDPFPKASYLFALVAGRFARLTDSFITRSGRRIQLAVHAQAEDLPFCEHGLAVLKQAMAWDEEAYGCEYDLDTFNVAVMRNYPGGAMECKGLNLYASEFFLTSPRIATDEELLRVEAVIAHEYFHNWTGNRIGCRDWFELSLKEGFTVYRQQQFMATLLGATAARIDDVTRLRELQFPEDDGRLAHAVRPDSYLAMSNLYTRTVYEKGAELIRMMSAMAGEARFREAAREFFRRYDGRAATIDALVETVEQVARVDLTQFRRWYDVPGRLHVHLEDSYDSANRRYTLVARQRRAADGAAQTVPMHLPMKIGLIGPDGEALTARLGNEHAAASAEHSIELRHETEALVFADVPVRPIPSLFRSCSAPVQFDIEIDDAALGLLATSDRDGFNRWEAGRRLATRTLLRYAEADWDTQGWLHLIAILLDAEPLDLDTAGRMLRLPSIQQLAAGRSLLDIDRLNDARRALGLRTAQLLRDKLRRTYARSAGAAAAERAFGARCLRNRCLWYLMQYPEDEDLARCWTQFRSSRMEDVVTALQALVNLGGTHRDRALGEFHERWRSTPAALDHWFAVQAAAEAEDCAMLVASLTRSPDFSLHNATRLKAIFDSFTANLPAFHHRAGVGYETVLDVVLALNEPNPRLAARFLKAFDTWQRLDEPRRDRLRGALDRLANTAGLAPELYEIASRSLWAEEPAAAGAPIQGRS